MQFNSLALLNKGQTSEVRQMSKCVWFLAFVGVKWKTEKSRWKKQQSADTSVNSVYRVTLGHGWTSLMSFLFHELSHNLLLCAYRSFLHSHGLSDQTFLRFAGILVQAAEPLLWPFIQDTPLHCLYLQLNVLSNNHWEHFQDPCTFTWTGTQYWKDVLLAGLLCFLPWLHFPVWIYTAALQWGKLLWAGGTGGFEQSVLECTHVANEWNRA